MIRFRGGDPANTHLAITRGTSNASGSLGFYVSKNRGVAQLVARTAGGREVASSSLVTPTIFDYSKDAKIALEIIQKQKVNK